MNVSTLYVLWSAPVRVCTGKHWADEPQPLIVTSVPAHRQGALVGAVRSRRSTSREASVVASRPIEEYGSVE